MDYRGRISKFQNPLSKKLFEIILEKETNLALSCDETKSERILELADTLGPKICLLKLHVDIIEDYTPDFPSQIKELSRKHNFLIFEDRKFADIGNTVMLQYQKGIYHIADWADIVNAHTVPGPGIIEGLREIAMNQSEPRGLILLAQMTPEGTLATGEYTRKSVEMARKYPDFVTGFIGSSKVSELEELRAIAGDDFVIMTPGVKLAAGGDAMGQRYSTPQDVVQAGSDVIIVGRGIYESDNPEKTAEEYRLAGYQT
ncbi:orotidine-5'-phosphate decarboxylase [Patescibacteria group bacterium]|nr:orotidine-5'-phosphate decarboxylase [Patescibacteria group bacterium]